MWVDKWSTLRFPQTSGNVYHDHNIKTFINIRVVITICCLHGDISPWRRRVFAVTTGTMDTVDIIDLHVRARRLCLELKLVQTLLFFRGKLKYMQWLLVSYCKADKRTFEILNPVWPKNVTTAGAEQEQASTYGCISSCHTTAWTHLKQLKPFRQ